eukprot:TRINITY_DN9152_c0_g1_i2.p1 TRINITY_DN9152_c0_g1~~TRINITY_DN9152_c0_g1_i2.p1  ORF type:complete len:186 (+),score=30.01 TRINITY_DN9152_c0_g1_i2:34-558(+)
MAAPLRVELPSGNQSGQRTLGNHHKEAEEWDSLLDTGSTTESSSNEDEHKRELIYTKAVLLKLRNSPLSVAGKSILTILLKNSLLRVNSVNVEVDKGHAACNKIADFSPIRSPPPKLEAVKRGKPLVSSSNSPLFPVIRRPLISIPESAALTFTHSFNNKTVRSVSIPNSSDDL